MVHLLKKWSWAVISVLILFNFSGCEKPDDRTLISNFFEARQSGNTSSAYEMLSEKSRKSFSKEQFENYCFVFRVIDYSIENAEKGYFAVNYNYYDKKFNKDTKELYTYYINQNLETLKIIEGKIVFPHSGFVLIRKFIEDKNQEEVKKMFELMLTVDDKNPDVIKSSLLMGFQTDYEK